MFILCIVFTLLIIEVIIFFCLIKTAKTINRHSQDVSNNPFEKTRSCLNCENFHKCEKDNNSFEFSEYGYCWANWCSDFTKR